MKLLSFIIFVPLGFALVAYTSVFYNQTGDWAWATRLFGRAGTYTALKLVGVIFIFLPLLHAFGAFDPIFDALSSIGVGR